MAENRPNNAHGNDTLPLQYRRRTSGTGGSSFGQVSCRRRIVASKYQHSGQTNILTSSVRNKNHTQNRKKVHLKKSTGLLVGRGVVESQVRIGDDVAGLILFPHQIVVRVMEVYACGILGSTEDDQVLRECIGEIVRWSRSFIEAIDMVPDGSREKIRTSEAFHCNEDILLKETILSRSMEESE